MDRFYRRRVRKWEPFDRIELKLVPRYKTSEISGDEWRTGVEILFYFKGKKVNEEFFTSMEAAIMFLPSLWVQKQEPIVDEVINAEEFYCDQPGCSNSHNRKRRYLKRIASNEGWLDPIDRTTGKVKPISHYRMFCDAHSKRGDCGLEDADVNYVDDPKQGLMDRIVEIANTVDIDEWEKIPKTASKTVGTSEEVVPEQDQYWDEWYQTFYGHKFYIMNPRPDDIDIMDIAHSLSMICRFNGHCVGFYSVAQHSIYVMEVFSKMMNENGVDVTNRMKLCALLHDAAEAYIGDITCPFKNVLRDVSGIEEKIQLAILEKFGLLKEWDQWHPHIKRADCIVLATEKRDIITKVNRPDMRWRIEDNFEPDDSIRIVCNSSLEEIKKRFLDLFRCLRLFS